MLVSVLLLFVVCVCAARLLPLLVAPPPLPPSHMLCLCAVCLQACADKLNRELDTYGCPPKFPTDDEPEVKRGDRREERGDNAFQQHGEEIVFSRGVRRGWEAERERHVWLGSGGC